MKYKGYLAFDFDAVIATYYRPFKKEVLGKPNQSVISTMKKFYNAGYHITIFTGREWTSIMEKWLKDNKVKYHEFETKRFYDVIIDDKAINLHFKLNKKRKKELVEDINNILNRKW